MSKVGREGGAANSCAWEADQSGYVEENLKCVWRTKRPSIAASTVGKSDTTRQREAERERES
jgi:hypothetical protein